MSKDLNQPKDPKKPKEPTGEFGEVHEQGKTPHLDPIKDERAPVRSQGLVNRPARTDSVAIGAHGQFVVPKSANRVTTQDFQDWLIQKLAQEWDHNRLVHWSGTPQFEVHQRVDGDYDLIFEMRS